MFLTPISACLCLLLQFHITNSQEDCSEAPTDDLKVVCWQLHMWDAGARKTPTVSSIIAKPPAIPGMENMVSELAPFATIAAQCMDLGCLCSYMGGIGRAGSNVCTLANGQPLKKAVRKEYRMLSDDERSRFHAAVKAIKESGEYDRMASIHSNFSKASGAHSGPSFLPWHREFIKRFEIALRIVDPTVSLPYWDSTIDGKLTTPAESALFTPEFSGSTDGAGNVISGDFKEFATLSGRQNILRAVGKRGVLFKEDDINSIMAVPAEEIHYM